MSNFEQIGFLWPEETSISNEKGETKTIRPQYFSPGKLANSRTEKEREYYRFYLSGNSIYSEAELKIWQVGGNTAIFACYKIIDADVELGNATIQTLRTSLSSAGYNEIQISYVTGWLIDGGYLIIDEKTKLLSNSKPNSFQRVEVS